MHNILVDPDQRHEIQEILKPVLSQVSRCMELSEIQLDSMVEMTHRLELCEHYCKIEVRRSERSVKR